MKMENDRNGRRLPVYPVRRQYLSLSDAQNPRKKTFIVNFTLLNKSSLLYCRQEKLYFQLGGADGGSLEIAEPRLSSE